MNWQPIETAPKDGAEILLSNGKDVQQGWWMHDEGGTIEHRDLDGRWIGQDDREGYIGWWDMSGGMQPEPTHWMPLPAAPGEECRTCSGHGAVGNILTAEPCPDCARCSGSGEDPEGYLTQGRGPDDHTVDGPCRECDGSGEARKTPATPSAALRLANELQEPIFGFPEPTQLEVAAAAELLRLEARVESLELAINEWHEKTDWVQSTIKPRELGMHRADVLRARIEALDAENKALRARLAADVDPALSREVYRACNDLPEAWAIRIDLESGFGRVMLIDPDGEENELPVDGMLSDAMRASIAAAQEAAKEAP